ncbi:MAG TPA: hypothetical protein VF774_06530 [Pseudoduganella sp.]|jgi:hypothetical protein
MAHTDNLEEDMSNTLQTTPIPAGIHQPDTGNKGGRTGAKRGQA